MALLQALPDLPPGDDEEEDRLLAELAAKFSPEDVQLLYQIAINARRDLDYAPDARAGFEMALLRMLAFRPQGAPPAAAQPPASGRTAAARGVSAAVATRAAPVAASPVGSSAPVATDWGSIVTALGLQGTARHFAANCVMLERRPGIVRLRLDPAGESFRRPQIESRLAEALSQYFGEPVRLEITQAESPDEILTPAKRDALVADDRQRAAEAAIESDPAVRAMRDVFGATVRPGSVKPLG
jgi:DNA polymerase-3 subunit gamma/tau